MEKVKQVIVFRKDLNVRKGKFASQVAHASLAVILNMMKKFNVYWRAIKNQLWFRAGHRDGRQIISRFVAPSCLKQKK